MNQKPKRFLSLKWKALYLSSFLFVLLTVVYLLSGKAYIDRQFQVKRDTANQQYSNELRVLVEQSAQQLHQLAGTVVNMEGMGAALSTNDLQQIRDAFENHWWKFEIDSAVDSAAFYIDNGDLLVRWGMPVNESGLVKKTIETESPQWQVRCEQSCQILAALPLLVDGQFHTVVVFSTSFTDVILNFHSITGSDIGVLVDVPRTSRVVSEKSFWQRKLIAMTDAKKNTPLLNDFAVEHPSLIAPKTHVLFTRNPNTYEISMLPISRDETGDDSRIIIVSNVTADIEGANRIFRNTLLGAIFGLLVSELILLAILWKPTTQLQRVVDVLPMLAENNFDQARASFRDFDKEALVTDESDILKATSLNLSYQLEALHSLLNNRAVQLEARGVELETEKNFVMGLLNTAHALILTQDSKGEVLMINHHGEKLIGAKVEDVVGSQFVNLLEGEQDTEEIAGKLKLLLKGDVEDFHHESIIANQQGESRFMSWFHSRLPDRDDGEHHILTVAIDISERRIAEENLGWLANHDPLTGLLNRRRFEDELDHIMVASQRYGHAGALLFFDLDEFKDVNDTSGHQVGDELLKRVAESLQETAREADVVARLGGDEFAIILQEANEYSAGETADRFCRALIKIAVPGINRVHRISASIGVAMFPEHGADPTELLAHADIAMYQAKAAGRNTWSIFNEDQHGKERIHERVYWNEQVKQIISDESFDVYFQPIVCVSNNEIVHYEALLRVPDEEGQMAPPYEFISAAERGGLMQSMDEKIISKVMLYQSQLIDKGVQVKFTINLSGLSFRNDNLISHIRSCLEKYDIDPEDIIFEITETAAVADVESAVEVINEIRAIGCRFALDDFGVGFSSLHYLKRLPVDFLKIDGSFISRLHVDKEDRILVQALVNIARQFGQMTVAEFVDNEEIMVVLKQLGVDYAQGFHLARPMPYSELWSGTVSAKLQ